MRLAAVIALLGYLAGAGPARAQSCVPIRLLLVEVRDPTGRRIAPATLDSIVATSTTERGLKAVRARVYPSAAALVGDTATLLRLPVPLCYLRLDQLMLHSGRQRMHLKFDLVLDTQYIRPGTSTFLIQAPAFQHATFRLRWDATQRGGQPEAPRFMPDRVWERVPTR